ncbi:MAG: hypothetical protein L0H86_09495 [Micrococcaceae bacterium]|uniref:hypothetical protein n=1 Tax=Yaniella sp. TaxID=2773929 RepID=UPI00264984C3|nr:hypothetical protein [Yaniella sp.]MDN5742218.1 hypothetical protein [Yaniella sp.]MDN5816251.1 hypothetical protein [Yaniella sp.]MDN5878975.1 hypothetical protein [Micrococcaceae bacterium]MDN5905846.1 hypothetical protein [Micrococcaceae bacterium]
MILADAVSCLVPGGDVVKGERLSCTLPTSDAAALTTGLAAWATALFTLLLAIFAFAAWRQSKRQAEEENTRLQKQIDAITETSERDREEQASARQIQALAEHLTNWRTILYRFKQGRWFEGVPTSADIRSSGALWRLHHHRCHEELKHAHQRFEDRLVDEISPFLIDFRETRVHLVGPPQFIEVIIQDFIETMTRFQLENETRADVLAAWIIAYAELETGEYINTWQERTNN